MINASNNYAKYRIMAEYPTKPKSIKKYNYNLDTPQNVRKYADALEEFTKAMEEYDAEVKKYLAAEKSANDKFEKDLTADDIQAGKSSKAVKKIFQIACELVEFSGIRSEWLSGIEERYKDLIEILDM